MVVDGNAAESLEADAGTVIASPFVCDRCEAEGDRERRDLAQQYRRLMRRGFDRDEASRIICRRVDRYFRNGTFVPLSKRATA